jgi:hypothetical protein
MEVPVLSKKSQKSVDEIFEVYQLGDGHGGATGPEFVKFMGTDGRGGCPGTVESQFQTHSSAKVSLLLYIIQN